MLLQSYHFITKMNATITCILFYLFHWKMVADAVSKMCKDMYSISATTTNRYQRYTNVPEI